MMKKKKQPFQKKRGKKAEDSNEFTTAPASEVKLSNLEPEAESPGDSGDELRETRQLVQKQNRKNRKSGGFQSMGLSNSIFKGITRKGYKVPTPIQRKTIPVILDGKDVVAMARTGSGKSAAFLIPLFEKLKVHSTKVGARALIMSPTRELALQTLKFARDLGRFTSLRFACVLGGDRLEDQFAALHESPDAIIATPGRFLHVLMEMDLKLHSVEYVVFDEADRLFEMGFQEQLQEVLKRLPEGRQTLLFSATLPKLLVEFARAGLHDPTLVRLDVETKLSEQLELSFLHCRASDKIGILLHLLRNVIKKGQQTVVFVATKHHVEYLQMLLHAAGIEASYIYSSLDATARKINIGKFQYRKTSVMIVTDLAARGIDIPMLDYVINFHFPAKPKLFVHRVGRVARAGRSGTAFSLVSQDELPYVLDLHLFLGRPINIVTKETATAEHLDGCYGRVPQSVVDTEMETVKMYLEDVDLESQFQTAEKAFGHYIRSRPAPSNESIKRTKELDLKSMAIHPLLAASESSEELNRLDFLERMKNFKPHTTIFEINKDKKNHAADIMRTKRNYHGTVIETNKQREEGATAKRFAPRDQRKAVEESTDQDIEATFASIIQNRKPKVHSVKVTESNDSEFYIPYRPKDHDTEKGYGVNAKGFHQQANSATMEIMGDDDTEMRRTQNGKKWDRKRKKFVSDSGGDPKKNPKKIRTESGVLVPATFKKDLYQQWLKKSKQQEADEAMDSGDEVDDVTNQKRGRGLVVLGHVKRRGKGYHQKSNVARNPRGGELKTRDQILKERKIKDRKQGVQKRMERKHKIKKASFGGRR